MCSRLTCQKRYTVIHMVNQIELFWLSETIITFEKFSFFLSFFPLFLFGGCWCAHHLFLLLLVFVADIFFQFLKELFQPQPWTENKWNVCGLWLGMRWENGVRVDKMGAGKNQHPELKSNLINLLIFSSEMGLLIASHHFAFRSCLSQGIFIYFKSIFERVEWKWERHFLKLAIHFNPKFFDVQFLQNSKRINLNEWEMQPSF